jgi:hypothetical protein
LRESQSETKEAAGGARNQVIRDKRNRGVQRGDSWGTEPGLAWKNIKTILMTVAIMQRNAGVATIHEFLLSAVASVIALAINPQMIEKGHDRTIYSRYQSSDMPFVSDAVPTMRPFDI